MIESNGTIKVVIVFCDSWDSTSFEEEHREEPGPHAHVPGPRPVLLIRPGMPAPREILIATSTKWWAKTEKADSRGIISA